MRGTGSLALIPLAFFGVSCSTATMSNDFASDAGFLDDHTDGRLFESGTGAFVVSPVLQGRVMTSTVRHGGRSHGFVNRAEIRAPTPGAAFANYGGEDRFWIGPEAGPYALYFGSGENEQVADNWRVPAPLNEGAWEVVHESEEEIRMTRAMELENRLGTRFSVGVERTIRVPGEEELGWLGGHLDGASWVAFESVNSITNTGEDDWHEDTGLLCVWILGQFDPGPRAFAILPFRTDGFTPPVETGYFNPLGEDRVRQGDDFVLFKVDADYRSKVGMYRDRAREVIGAWDPDTRILTLVRFGPIARKRPYLVELWDPEHPEPYNGDVVNSYNHGGPEPFYELETSSPALSLGPQQSSTHRHMTVHVHVPEGQDPAALVRDTLGVDWSEVRQLAGW